MLDDTLADLKQAGILLGAAAGVGMVSGAHLQMSANQNLIATAGGNADIGVIKRFTVAAGEAVSLFAQKLGMKLLAAKGKVEIQAQGDEMALAALKDVTITSTEGKLILSAAKEVWIGAGGSYIRINAERIENGTPGDILEKCASWDKSGANSSNIRLPLLPVVDGELGDQHFVLRSHGGNPVPNQRYRIYTVNGVVDGRTDAGGRTEAVEGYVGQEVRIELQDDDYDGHFVLRDPLGEPVENMRYRIVSEGGKEIEGVTDVRGKTSLLSSEKAERIQLFPVADTEEYPADTGVN